MGRKEKNKETKPKTNLKNLIQTPKNSSTTQLYFCISSPLHVFLIPRSAAQHLPETIPAAWLSVPFKISRQTKSRNSVILLLHKFLGFCSLKDVLYKTWPSTFPVWLSDSELFTWALTYSQQRTSGTSGTIHLLQHSYPGWDSAV